MINGSWELSSIVKFLTPEVSDHSPSLIQLESNQKSPPKPFKFFNFWALHEKFMETVENSWKLPVEGTPMRALYMKMKRLKGVLKEFNKTHFGGISIRVIDKRKELEVVQRQILAATARQSLLRRTTS
ncbi:hypothetical protein DITRI_Ditri04bG0052900 [Diplodiscus trichospermus]